MTWYYLSFVDDETDTCSGLCYVQGGDAVMAVRRAWDLKINPGGQVMALGPLPDDEVRAKVDADDLERLMTNDYLLSRYGGVRLGDLSEGQLAAIVVLP